MAIKIFSDTGCDLPGEYIDKYDIGLVPYGISYGDDKYYADYFEIKPAEFYKKLRESNAFPKTSQPTFMEYEDKFRPFLEKGDDIICLTLSKKFSGSFQSGATAETNLRKEFPDRKITVLDSERATVLYSILVLQACQMRDDGKSYEEIVDKIKEIRADLHIYVTVDSLEYLQKGGRVGRASALAGSLLNVKPIIAFYDGELQPQSKVRGKKKAMDEIVKLIAKDAEGKIDKYIPITFCCDDTEAALEMRKKLETEHGFKFPYPTLYIGPVVGAHLGPTGFAAAILRRHDK